jgi:hypothetical protein
MTSLAFTAAGAELHTHDAQRAGTRPGARLKLLPSGDGWSLVTPEGELAFRALGLQGRRRCLEFAQARGVLVVSS